MKLCGQEKKWVEGRNLSGVKQFERNVMRGHRKGIGRAVSEGKKNVKISLFMIMS